VHCEQFLRLAHRLAHVANTDRPQKPESIQTALSNQLNAKNVLKRPIAVKILLLLSAFLILAIAYYYNFCRFPRTSDDANILLAGSEISDGNWRLKGWWLPEDNFLTIDLPLYALVVKGLGFTPYIMFYLPAALWAGVALLSLVLSGSGLTGRKKMVALAAVTTPVLLPIIGNHSSMETIAHVWPHTGTILYVLLIFFLAKMAMSGQRAHSTSILMAYTFIVVLAAFGDSFAIYIGILPVVTVAAFSIFCGSKSRQNLLVLVLTLFAGLLGKILVEVNSITGGFHLIHLPVKFVEFDELGKNVVSVIQYFFKLFGCDFFGREVFAFSIDGAALPLIRLPFLALLVAAFIAFYKKLFGSIRAIRNKWPVLEDDYLDAFLAVAFTMNVLAAVFSDRITDAGSIRFMVPALVFGAIFIARAQIKMPWVGTYFYFALLVSMGFSLISYARNPRSSVLVSREIEAVSQWLSNNELCYGFGPYWSSSIVTAATNSRVEIRAVVADSEGKLKPFEWNNNREWYHTGATGVGRAVFVLAHEEEKIYYGEADVLRTLGEPLQKHEIGPYIINLYDSGNERLKSLFLPSSEQGFY
jgi:hypothetical protein